MKKSIPVLFLGLILAVLDIILWPQGNLGLEIDPAPAGMGGSLSAEVDPNKAAIARQAVENAEQREAQERRDYSDSLGQVGRKHRVVIESGVAEMHLELQL